MSASETSFTSVLLVFPWTSGLPGKQSPQCFHMPVVEATPQDRNSEKGTEKGEGGHLRPCCSSQELGTEGLESTAHIFADFSALCQLRAFTSQKFV